MTRAIIVTCLAVILVVTSRPAAQATAGSDFEVVSVKPSSADGGDPSKTGTGMRIESAAGRFTASNVPLRHLVLIAYDLHDSQVVGGPDWRTSRTFDIKAIAKDPVSGLDAMLPMLKALLADRFRLEVHTEMREMAVSTLVIARDDGKLGPNITRSSADCSRRQRN